MFWYADVSKRVEAEVCNSTSVSGNIRAFRPNYSCWVSIPFTSLVSVVETQDSVWTRGKERWSLICRRQEGIERQRRYSATHSLTSELKRGNFTSWPLYPREGTPVPIENDARLAPESVWPFSRRQKTFSYPACTPVTIPTALPPLSYEHARVQ